MFCHQGGVLLSDAMNPLNYPCWMKSFFGSLFIPFLGSAWIMRLVIFSMRVQVMEKSFEIHFYDEADSLEDEESKFMVTYSHDTTPVGSTTGGSVMGGSKTSEGGKSKNTMLSKSSLNFPEENMKQFSTRKIMLICIVVRNIMSEG